MEGGGAGGDIESLHSWMVQGKRDIRRDLKKPWCMSGKAEYWASEIKSVNMYQNWHASPDLLFGRYLDIWIGLTTGLFQSREINDSS